MMHFFTILVQRSGIYMLCCVFLRRFCVVVNELEMMMQTLITSIFSTVYCVEEGVRLLDIFEPLSAREVTETCVSWKFLVLSLRGAAELQVAALPEDDRSSGLSDNIQLYLLCHSHGISAFLSTNLASKKQTSKSTTKDININRHFSFPGAESEWFSSKYTAVHV